jgi:hypothetical protein
MKRSLVAILMAATLAISVLPNAYAALTPGSKCSKAGIKQDYKGKTYTCLKSGNKLVWDKGFKAKTYDAAFAAAFLAEAQDEAEQILADAKLRASQISRPPNCAVGNSQAFVSFGTDPNLPDPFTALIYENPGICELVVRATAEFDCPGSVTVISRSTFTLKAREKIFVSWRSVERYFPLVKIECQLLTGKTPKTIGVPNSYLTRQPNVIVESSKYSGVFNQADATKKANQIIKSAQSSANQIIADAKNPAVIAKAWRSQQLPGSGNLCIPNKDCPIGSTGPGGGIVFYDAGSQQSWGRYLEVAPAGWLGTPEDPQIQWCGYTAEFLTHGYKVIKEIEAMALRDVSLKAIIGSEIGKGRGNTDVLLALCPEGAAPTANLYKGGGKSDWHLPSRDELNELCKYALSSPIGKSAAICQYQKYRKGFADWNYWSSSIAPDGLCKPWGSPVWIQTFWNGEQECGVNGTFNVRPIRAFPFTKSATEKVIDWKPVKAALEKAAAEKAAAEKAAVEKAAAEKAAAEKAAAEKAAAEKAAAEKAAADAEAKDAAYAAAKAAFDAATGKVCVPGSNCPIGSTGPGGGIIFYDAGSQQSWGRYLEVAPVGWSGTATDPLLIWCNVANLHFTASISDVSFRATIGVEIGKGKANTNLMVSRCSSGAGVLANAYKGGGKSDWFLPSRDELNELCKYAKYQATGKGDDVCQKGTSSVGGFDYQPLWSSSEATAGGAWGQNFYYGTYIENLSKYNLTSVRPIRAF